MKIFAYCLAFAAMSMTVYAKRMPPKPVEPVIYEGVEYRAPTEKMGYVQAWKDGALLWEKEMYTVQYTPGLEKDVQDVFITDLQVADNVLTVQNEKGETFTIDMNPKTVPRAEKKGDTEIVHGNTAFAMDLYQQLGQKEGNLFFSPYSISTALAMVYGGAKGKTADQMAQTMHFDPNDDVFHENYGQLINHLNEQGEKENYKLLIANALWGQRDFRFLDPYLNLAKHNYGANLELVDYITAAEKARQTINAWVEDKTEDKIKDLIPQGTLDAQTRLVLTNAIYFKGDWAEQFDKTETKPAPFYLNHTDTVQAPLMYRRGHYRYGEFINVKYASIPKSQILELPYKGEELSMIILLPEERGVNRLEDALSAEALKEWTKDLKSQEVDVYLPRFKLTSQFELSDTLGKMGMPLAFSPQAADFSGMTGHKDLFISKVIHKAYVDVNEEGTEAAAATGIMMLEGGYSIPEPPPVFRADRPFVFLIRDNATGSILFMGRVANPTEENSKS